MPCSGRRTICPRLVREYAVHRVAIAFSTDSHDQTLGVIRSMQDSDVQIDIVPRMFEVLGTNAQLHTIEGMPLVGLPSTHLSGSSRLLKRWLDLSAATLGLVLLAPVFVVVAVLDQARLAWACLLPTGSDGRARAETFRVFKFRTMVDDAESRKVEIAHLNMHNGDDPRMFKVPDDPRVTRLGRFLRRWRIDELPQLLNVAHWETCRSSARARSSSTRISTSPAGRGRRLDLKPGITGLWQVLGASDIPFEEMTKLDYLYVTNWSLREDLRLILLTLPALTRARAAY